MAHSLRESIDNEVSEVRDKPLRWLSHQHFFRDPPRPLFSDPTRFFSPADGVVMYNDLLDPDESVV